MKPRSKKFDIANFDNLASFCFSYQHGEKDEDEISSDQVLVSKEINIDGNLMVQFRLISESSGKDLRTNNVYKYYYCPTDDKRIFVHVKHQVFEGGEVTGIENVDGRYGALASVHSKSGRIKRMRFGSILPYMHIHSENNIVKEYKLNTDPESKETVPSPTPPPRPGRRLRARGRAVRTQRRPRAWRGDAPVRGRPGARGALLGGGRRPRERRPLLPRGQRDPQADRRAREARRPLRGGPPGLRPRRGAARGGHVSHRGRSEQRERYVHVA